MGCSASISRRASRGTGCSTGFHECAAPRGCGMRHTHATHALARGAELTTVRDNLRHASISTTSIYLHGDDVKRARQLSDAFSAEK
ncbi:tyrosine-type recombinase/integrase [Burkholderia ubonensis]|uniref:tyrosine-type recombinase/integrase n=1 Tax=Burkholderia ubonensis TaxID=101571 RepID=UPI0039F55993